MPHGRATGFHSLFLALVALIILPGVHAAFAVAAREGDKPYVGVLVSAPSRSAQIGLGLASTDPGVLVVGLDAGSPAEQARLEVGDLIIAADGEPIYSPHDLDHALLRHAPPSVLPLRVRHGSETHEISVRVIDLPPGYLGFEIVTLAERDSIRTRLPSSAHESDSLAVVVWAEPSVPGFRRAGFGPGAVILALNGKEMRSPAELRRAAQRLWIGEAVSLVFARHGKERWLGFRAQAPPRPWAGLRLEEMSPLLVEAESLSTDAAEMGGLFVRRVEAGSPAEKAGLRAGDRLLRIGAKSLDSVEGFDLAYDGLRPGATAPIHIARREGTTGDLTLERAARLGTPRGGSPPSGTLGFEVPPGPRRPGTLGMNLFEGRADIRLGIGRHPLPPIPLPFSWTKVTGPRFGGITRLYWDAGRGTGWSVAAPGGERSSDATISASWVWDYGVADERWHHVVSVAGRPAWAPAVSYRDEPAPFYHEEISNPVEATARALLWGEDKLRYVRARGWTAAWRLTHRRLAGHEARIDFAFLRETPLANVPTSSLFGAERFTPNPVADVAAGRLHAATLRYGYSNIHWRTWTRVLIDGEVRAAGGPLGGDREFVRWEANLAPSLRLHRSLYLDTRLEAGLATGRLPLQESFYVGGKGTLPGYADARFAGDRIALARTRLSLVPIGRPEQAAQFRLFAGFDAGQAWLGADRSGIPTLRKDVTLGAGLFVASGHELFFPKSVSVAWGRPLGDDDGSAWRFQFEFGGGATR